MADPTEDLRSYYEEEARRRVRKGLRGMRVTVRNEFLTLLAAEGRGSVVDFGAGPGGDGAGFVLAGHSFVGIDLAHGNAVLAAEVGVTVIQGSMTAPPLRPGSFEAGWSMSALMHLDAEAMEVALDAMRLVLVSNAPLMIGLWGSESARAELDIGLGGRKRPFELRSFADNRERIRALGRIERAETWDLFDDVWDYHVFLVRIEESTEQAAA